jgi:hypothetical protein
MLDADTFLTRLYVAVDDYCKREGIPPRALPGHRGPAPALAPSEVVTLAVYAQWARFASERGFYRHARVHLRGAFPRLPTRPQFNRLARAHQRLVIAFGHAVGTAVRGAAEPDAPYEVLDTAAVPTRNSKRGTPGRGWLAGQADIGYSSRLGWFEGLRLLAAVSPRGVITGYGVGSGSAKEQPLAEALLAARADPALAAALPQAGRGVGAGAADGLAYYAADSGFAGRAAHARWRACAHAVVITPPGGNWQGTSRERWPDTLRRWLAHYRQVVESVFDRLLFALRLSRERPHALGGFTARLAACVALYNFCLLTNHHLGRPLLAFADLIAW